MPIGHFSGYTGDTLVHLANGDRKYMCDLAPGDELKQHDSSVGLQAIVSEVIRFQFDGFISLVAPGLSTTRYTTYHNFNTGNDTAPLELNKPTLYYQGLLYNFLLKSQISSTIIMGTDPTTSQIGIYDIGKHPDNCMFLFATMNSNNSGNTLVPDIWSDPPGQISQRHPKTATV